MHGTNRPPFVDTIEIALDLPMPTSANRLWRHNRNSIKPFCSKEYLAWKEEADMTVMAARQFPRRKINGPFEIQILLGSGRGDGDNKIKVLLDWLQSRDIIRNDSDCRRGSWAWVEPERAPRGCRVILRSLHE